MVSSKLISFIDINEAFNDELNPEQIACVRKWAETIDLLHQNGYLECLMEFKGERLQIYLVNLIPGYPQGDK
jgi:hypothetical protein